MIMKRLETEDDAIITDLDGRTAIHEAIIHDNKAVLDELLEHEVARRAIDQPDRYKRTALHWAALRGRDDILQKLIDSGANLESTDNSGDTALQVATFNDQSEKRWIILLALIAKGAGNKVIEELFRTCQIEPGDTCGGKGTLLHHAVQKGHHAIARTLAQIVSSDVNVTDINRSTPLAYACQSEDEAMVEILLEAGADANTESAQQGGKILAKAAESANVAIVNRLIGAKADVDAKDNEGRTALLFTAFKGHVHAVEALINGGANVNVEDASGSSPLGMAAKEGHEPVVKLLLERGAKVNTSDKQGRSPLSYASGSGSNDCVDLLLDAGAMVGLEDADAMTPSSWARRNGHEAIARLLLEKENQYNSKQLQAADDEDYND